MTLERITPMEVGRKEIKAEDGYSYQVTHDPEFNDEWTDSEKLSWLLGCLKCDSDMSGITVYDSNYIANGVPSPVTIFGVSVPGMSTSVGTYREVWKYLKALEDGYNMAVYHFGIKTLGRL